MNSTNGAETIHRIPGVDSPVGSLGIPDGDIVQLWEGRIGAVIRCLSGVAWITQQEHGRDRVLDPGEEFLIDHAGIYEIQGLGPTRVALR